MISHTVQLNALMIINVHILGLSGCEHLMVLQETYVSNLVASLEFHDKVFLFPF